jgi:hypothetical protein
MALRGEANRRLVPTRLLQQFTGNACSTSRAVRNARFHFRSLYYCTALTRPHSRLSRTALQDLEVWTHFQYDSQLNSVPLFTSPTSRTLYTDASSGVGWGGVLPPLQVQELVSSGRSGPSRDVDCTTPSRGGGDPRSPLAHEHQRSLTLGRGPAPAAHQLQGTAGCSPQSVGLTIGPPRTSRLAVLRQHHRRPAPSQGDKPFATGCWTGTLVADSFGKVCYCPLALRL